VYNVFIKEKRSKNWIGEGGVSNLYLNREGREQSFKPF
jgi:predicted AlkP superfamily phosphohydrolase/phosphomutase